MFKSEYATKSLVYNIEEKKIYGGYYDECISPTIK